MCHTSPSTLSASNEELNPSKDPSALSNNYSDTSDTTSTPSVTAKTPPSSIALPPIESIPVSNHSISLDISTPVQRITSPAFRDTPKPDPSPNNVSSDKKKVEWKYNPHETHTTREKVVICVYIISWFTCSIASLFIAKHILHTYKVNESVFTLWLFASSSVYGILFTKIFRLHHLTILTKQQLKAVIPLSVAFLIKEILKYASLARVSVNLVNTIRSLGPLFAVLMEYIFLHHRPPRKVLLSLTPIIFGVALTSLDELHISRNQNHAISAAIIGFICAIASTAINNAQNIYSKLLFGHKKIDPVSLQIYLSACSLLLITPYTIPSLLTSKQPTNLPPNVIILMLLSGLVNFAASQLAFNTLNKITPLSYSVANTAKRVAIAVIAIWGFGEYLSKWNGLGIGVSIVGVAIYERAARGYKAARMYSRTREKGGHRRTGSEV